MRLNIFVFCIVLAVFVLTGCTTQISCFCKPVLFPYPEYRYRAERYVLDEDYSMRGGQEVIDFYGLQIPIPDGWRYEKVFGKTIKISKNKKHFFWLSMKQLKQHPVYPGYVNSIGCDWSGFQSNETSKSDKEYFEDLYLFTDSQLTDTPDAWPWQFMILHSKSEYFYDARRIIHYKGSNLNAFQKNSDPYIQPDRHIPTVMEIFPDKIASGFFEMGSSFEDDVFFAEFVNALNVFNPSPMSNIRK